MTVPMIPRAWLRIAPLPLHLVLGTSLVLTGCSTATTASRQEMGTVPVPATVAKLQEQMAQERLQAAPNRKQEKQDAVPQIQLVNHQNRSEPELAPLPPAEPELAEPIEPLDNRQPETLLPQPEASETIPVSPLSTMTLENLQSLAISSNPSVQTAYAALEKARAQQYQVGLRANPTVGYFSEEIGDDGTAGKQGVFLNQTFVTGGKLEQNQQVAAQEIRRLEWELQTQQIRVRTDVRQQFYTVLGARKRVELIRNLESLLQDAIKNAQGLLDAGEVSQADVLQLEILGSELGLLRTNTELELRAASLRLGAVIGQPEQDFTQVVGELEVEGESLEWDSSYQQILQSSPQLQSAMFRVERARQLIVRQELQPIPNIHLNAGVAHDFASGDDVANVQIGVPLPLYNDNSGNISAACAEYRRSLQEVEALRLSLRSQFAQAFQQYQQARNRVDVLDQQILPKAEKNRELVGIAYQAGELDVLRVFVAQRSYVEVSLELIQARVQLQQARAIVEGQLLTGSLTTSIDTELGTGLRDDAVGGQQ